MPAPGFIDELKRRKVVRVGVVYLASATVAFVQAASGIRGSAAEFWRQSRFPC